MQVGHFDMHYVHETIAIDMGLNFVKHVVGNFNHHETNFKKLLVFMLIVVLPFRISIVYIMYDKFTISEIIHMTLCRLLVHVLVLERMGSNFFLFFV